MKSHVIALAALAAIGFSGAAFAEEATPGKAKGLVAMSDSEMNNVTAAGFGVGLDQAQFHALEATQNAWNVTQGLGLAPNGFPVGRGTLTACGAFGGNCGQ